MKLRKHHKSVRPYFKNKKRLEKLSKYSIEQGRCLLCFIDVRIIHKQIKMDFLYKDYSKLQVYKNTICICKDCLERFKEVKE